MNRTSVGLGILLALSLGVNLALAGRRGPAPPAPPPSSPARPAAVVSTSDAPLQEERRKVELLETRVRELEAEKRILAESGPAPDRLDQLRQKLRRVAKLYDGSDPDAWNDPANQLDYQDTALDIQRLHQARSRDPKSYQNFLRLLYEMALETPPLPEAQRVQAGRIFDDLAAAVGQVKADTAGERLIAELELEDAALEKLHQTLGSERAQQLRNYPLLAFGTSTHAHYIQDDSGAGTVLSAWTSLYGLDAAQKEAARPLASRYFEELKRLSSDPKDAHAHLRGGTAEARRFRRDALRAQIETLRQLGSGWTPEQRERLRTQAPQTFLVFPSALRDSSTEEDENP